MHRTGFIALQAVMAFALVAPLSAQSAPPDFRDEWRGQFESSARKLVSLAEAMPEADYGWRPAEEVASRATLNNDWQGPLPRPKNTLSASATVASLSKAGVVFATGLSADSKAELLSYEGADGMEYWVGFHNFFVITKYNRSAMYALAAFQLGEEIAARARADAD